MTIWMPVEPEADELLSRSPLALVIAMLLDQQVTLEKAFAGPLDLVRRLGHEPTVTELAEFDPDRLAAIFSERPAVHRYPKAMAARVQDLARLIVDQYDGDAARLWETAGSGSELLKRVAALPGFGAQKAQIFVALLGKQLGVRPEGWREAAGAFGGEGTRLSVADITDPESLGEVRSYKQALKAAAKRLPASAAASAGSARSATAGQQDERPHQHAVVAGRRRGGVSGEQRPGTGPAVDPQHVARHAGCAGVQHVEAVVAGVADHVIRHVEVPRARLQPVAEHLGAVAGGQVDPDQQCIARASFPLRVLPLSRCSARCTGATRAHPRSVRGDGRGGDACVTFAPDSQPGSLGSNFDILVLGICRDGPGRC